MGAWTIYFFMLSKAWLCSGPQAYGACFFMRSCYGPTISAILGENSLRYCTILRKVCRSFRHVGFSISVIALTFVSLGLHPCVVYISPNNSTSLCLYWILSNLVWYCSSLWFLIILRKQYHGVIHLPGNLWPLSHLLWSWHYLNSGRLSPIAFEGCHLQQLFWMAWL